MLLRINNSLTHDKQQSYQFANALINEYVREVTHSEEYVSSLKYKHSQELKLNKIIHVHDSVQNIRKVQLQSKNFFLTPIT